MKYRPFIHSLLALTLITGLSGCSQEPPETEEVVRAIRSIVVTEPATGQSRRFSGIIEAASTSSLSFEVSGNVREVKVDTGQAVSKGQVLATLDDKTFQINVEAAEANVGRAEVEVEDARRESERLQEINSRGAGFVSLQMLDQAQAAYDAARKNLSYTRSRLNLAKRDLDRTTLRAPFEGVITRRNVDPFQEINRGERLFDLHAQGAMEAAISVPESEIKQVYLGLPGEIRLSALAGRSFRGIVTEISDAAGAANAFPVRLTIDADEPAIRPGLTAEVNLLLGADHEDATYLIPITALLPGAEGAQGSVFVFDTTTSTVKKTAITYGGIRDNNIIIESGLSAGDIIATAGVSFLQDGQQVRLMGQ
jgi:RND family efflux transporter MFP subunit